MTPKNFIFIFNLPKISIVTPSFNQAAYLEKTIQSILGQGYPNLEYIIIDGGSTDGSVEIIRKYESLLTFWVSETDIGQSDAINKGLSKCTGVIFNWINSDDYLEPGALLTIADAFKNPNIDIVCGYTSIFESSDEKEIMKHRTTIYNNVEVTLIQQRINQPAMFYRLSVLKNLRGINSSLHYSMDLELWFRYLCEKGQDKMTFMDNTFAHFRIHGSSKTGSYEERFRAEEKAIWYYMLSMLKANKLWVLLFKSKCDYKPLKPWKITSISRKQLEIELSKMYLYPVFKSGNKSLGRLAYITLLNSGRLTLNFQTIAMFMKLFIGNFPLRKFFKNHA